MSSLALATGLGSKTLTLSQARKVNAALSLGKFAWRNRTSIFKAAQRMRRGVKHARKKYKVGNPIGNSSCKRSYTTGDSHNPIALNSRTLYISNLLLIDDVQTGVYDELPNERQRLVTNIRGVKIRAGFENLNNTNPCCVNLALVTWRDQSDIGQPTGFLRSWDTTRSKDMGANLSSIEVNTNPINTDLIHVHWRKKFYLSPTTADNKGGSKPRTQVYWETYTPIKRQVRYGTQGNNTPDNTNLILVFWWDRLMDGNPTQPKTAEVNSLVNTVTFFREPR